MAAVVAAVGAQKGVSGLVCGRCSEVQLVWACEAESLRPLPRLTFLVEEEVDKQAMALKTSLQAVDMDEAADQVGDPSLRVNAHPSLVKLSGGVAKAPLEDGFPVLCSVWLSETFPLREVDACAQLPLAQFASLAHVWNMGTWPDNFSHSWELLRQPALGQSVEIVDKR